MASRVQQSHQRIIRKNDLQMSSFTNENVGQHIDSFKTRQGKPLSGNYKASLLATIKTENKEITMNAKDLRWYRKRNDNTPTSENFETIVKISRYAANTFFYSYGNINKTIIDTMIAILMVCFINCKLSILYTITVEELKQLARLEELNHMGQRIIPHYEFPYIYEKIQDLLQTRDQISGGVVFAKAISVQANAINGYVRRLAVMLNGTTGKFYGLRIFHKVPKDILVPRILSRGGGGSIGIRSRLGSGMRGDGRMHIGPNPGKNEENI